MIWIGIIIGIVIWQVCSLIFYYIWQHNEEKAIVASAGIAGGIVLLVGNTYIWLKKLWHSWFFKAALVKEGDEQIYYCRSKTPSIIFMLKIINGQQSYEIGIL